MKKCLMLLALFAAIPVGVLAQGGGVTVELSLNQQQYMPDEDIMVSLDLFNRSGQTIDFAKEKDWVSFSVQNEDNSVVPNIGDVPAGSEFSLLSGQVGTKTFNLTPYFGIRQTGHYKVVATVKIPKWNLEVTSKPATFMVMNGSSVPNLPDLTFGVPPKAGDTNATPEVRQFHLLRASYLNEPRIYFRLSDSTGMRTIRTYPLGRVVSFAKPEAQIDSQSNLHVLYQSFAKSFSYFVIDPNGKMLIRQTHDYTQTRPTLRSDSQGRIYVGGGARRFTQADWPPSTPSNIPANTNVNSQQN